MSERFDCFFFAVVVIVIAVVVYERINGVSKILSRKLKKKRRKRKIGRNKIKNIITENWREKLLAGLRLSCFAWSWRRLRSSRRFGCDLGVATPGVVGILNRTKTDDLHPTLSVVPEFLFLCLFISPPLSLSLALWLSLISFISRLRVWVRFDSILEPALHTCPLYLLTPYRIDHVYINASTNTPT